MASPDVTSNSEAPRALRRAGFTVLGVLLTGAAYLVWARGEAIVLDLATLAGGVWCF